MKKAKRTHGKPHFIEHLKKSDIIDYLFEKYDMIWIDKNNTELYNYSDWNSELSNYSSYTFEEINYSMGINNPNDGLLFLLKLIYNIILER